MRAREFGVAGSRWRWLNQFSLVTESVFLGDRISLPSEITTSKLKVSWSLSASSASKSVSPASISISLYNSVYLGFSIRLSLSLKRTRPLSLKEATPNSVSLKPILPLNVRDLRLGFGFWYEGKGVLKKKKKKISAEGD